MAEVIEMPKLSDTMEVGTIVTWNFKEGDSVKIGDELCDVETDKATMPLENLTAEGVLLKIYLGEGSEAPLGSPICAIGEQGEVAPEIDLPGKADVEEDATEQPRQVVEPEPEPEMPQVQGRKHEYIPEQAPSEKIVESPAPGARIKSSPLARKLAEANGVALHTLKGSGPGGRVLRRDVEAALEKGIPSAPVPVADGEVADTVALAPISGAKIVPDVQIKVSNMRKTIARRLVESKTQIPHFYLETEIDAGALTTMRAEINASLADLAPEKGGIKISVNDLILKASAEALRRVPGVNTSWMGDHIAQHGSVHLAFGVAVPDGLVTPVIRDANVKGLRQIAAEARSLIKKARDRKLTPEEMTGSTFTVTNLGMYGITGFFGIINPPNAAILSVGATVKKPVVGPADTLVIGQRMSVGLSGDHRVIDGATGAEFLMALKEIIETPALMLV